MQDYEHQKKYYGINSGNVEIWLPVNINNNKMINLTTWVRLITELSSDNESSTTKRLGLTFFTGTEGDEFTVKNMAYNSN